MATTKINSRLGQNEQIRVRMTYTVTAKKAQAVAELLFAALAYEDHVKDFQLVECGRKLIDDMEFDPLA